MFTTGISASDQLIGVGFSGNIIPQIWYKVFVKKDLKNPKPHLLAINILADIVFWYRPREERDEITGAIIGYSKRFSSDLLQRSYEQIAELFGCSKGQATDAIVFLEKMGVVERVFRTRNVNGVVCTNILYIALNVERLIKLTYPQEADTQPEVSRNFGGGVAKFQERGQEISVGGLPKFRDTNTEITTKITPENTPSIHQQESAPAAVCESDGLSEDELREKVEDDLFYEQQIPMHYKSDKRMMLTAIKIFSDWYIPMPERFRKETLELELEVFDMLVDCLAEMACADGNQIYKGAVVSYAKVIEQMNWIIQRDTSLHEFCNETIDDYVQAALKTEIKDKRKYMKSVIWNGFHTYRVKQQSELARDFAPA